MVAAFKGLAPVYYGFVQDDGSPRFKNADDKDIACPEGIELALCHFRDRSLLGGTGLTVFYGGSGGIDQSRRPTDRDVIWRPIDGTSGVLDPHEAEVLLKYARNVVAGNPTLRPGMLSEPRLRILPTLAILCQAYLTAYASLDVGSLPAGTKERFGPSGELSDAKVVSALAQMGWTALSKDGDAALIPLRTRSTEMIRTVSKSRWWLDLLGVPLGESRIRPEDWNEFCQMIADEWMRMVAGSTASPKELTGFIDLLKTNFEQDRDLKSLHGVAEVYCLLAQNLGGNPCQS